MKTCFNSLTCAVLCIFLIGSGSVAAQVRSEESASQRILPLPDGRLSNAELQMQLLQKLRSMVKDSEAQEAASRETPDIDDRQLQQLQQALKKLQDQLPPGMMPPDLDSIPEEQLDEAISNPAVQQQLKKMLEQFSKDGLLPQNDNGNPDSAMPPMPRKRGESSVRSDSHQRSERNRELSRPPSISEKSSDEFAPTEPGEKPSHPPAEKSWQALKDAMKKLSQIAQGEDHESPDDAESHQDSLQAFQDLLERYKDSHRHHSRRRESDSAASDDSARAEMRSGIQTPGSDSGSVVPEPDSSERIMRRPDRAATREPQVSPGPRMSERGEVFPPAEKPYRNPSRIGRELTDQRRKNQSSRENSNRSVSESPQPDIDIRRELDRSGFRGTIEKLVEKAREDSNARQRAQQQSNTDAARAASDAGGESTQPGKAVKPNVPPKVSSDTGMQESLKDLLSGLGEKIPDILKDAKLKDRPAEPRRNPESAGQPPSRDSSSPGSESQMKKWNDAASEFLSDLSKAPQASASPDSASKGETSKDVDSLLPIGSFLLTGLGLFGLLSVMAFCLRRPLLKMVSEATGISVPARTRPLREIHTRADVISAFHALVLNSKQQIESWWTHRAAVQELIAASPQQKNAVQTLAEIYEQARYLPGDVELPADTIQSARTALAECR